MNPNQNVFEKLSFNNTKKYSCSYSDCGKQPKKLIAIQAHQDSQYLVYEICINVFVSDCTNKKCFWHVFCLNCFVEKFNQIMKFGIEAANKLYGWN